MSAHIGAMITNLPDAMKRLILQLTGRYTKWHLALRLLSDLTLLVRLFNASRVAAMKQIGGQLGRKVAKQKRVTGALNSRPKGRKKHFKTELWYAAAYPKMSATRQTPSSGLKEMRAATLALD